MPTDGRLPGVSSLSIGSDGVVCIDTQNTGMRVWDGKGEPSFSARLGPGQSCKVSDGRHAFLTYKNLGVENDEALILLTDKFDAASFGGGVTESKRTVRVRPYNIAETPKAGPRQ